ncbi:hypothetical protein ETB55_04420 [Salmonella enterica subsp. enterica serovar Omuna]|nr:hypothetical protein [Salmonella enterica subsp. enterica serovar Omuna]
MSGMIDEIEGILGAGDSAADAGSVVNGVVNAIPSVSEMVGGVGAAVSEEPVGISAGSSLPGASYFNDWSGKSLEPIMKRLAVASLMPKRAVTAPLGGSGHGVSANASSNGQVIGQVESLAGGDPLQGLSGFKNLL